jgi:hypothetical protein
MKPPKSPHDKVTLLSLAVNAVRMVVALAEWFQQ